MPERLVSRLLSAIFILLMSGGGGDLPALDGLFFHSRDVVPATVASHVEVAGSCHADQCAIRSTAQHPRLTSIVTGSAIEWTEPDRVVATPVRLELRSGPSLCQPFSRAPPILQA